MQSEQKLILVADDNNENRQVLGSLLIINGYEVGATSDGHKAFELVNNKHPEGQDITEEYS